MMNMPYQSIWMNQIMKGIERYAPQRPQRSCSRISSSEKYSRRPTKHSGARIHTATLKDTNSATLNSSKKVSRYRK